MKERDVVAAFREAFPGSGIGDDAAVLHPESGDLLFASDAVVEGIHFMQGLSTLSQAVQKMITSNVADIFAMGGIPFSTVITVGLPEGCGRAELDEIIEGAVTGCRAYTLELAGGDTVLSPGGFFFDAAILGRVGEGKAVSRGGAREGDVIAVFGPCGGSAAGMSILAGIHERPAANDALRDVLPVERSELEAVKEIVSGFSLTTGAGEIGRVCGERGFSRSMEHVLRLIKHHLVPLAKPLESSLLASEPPTVTSMIDVSDGLARDISNLCAESGVGAVLDEASLPVPAGLGSLLQSSEEALAELALSSGEEYVLLATFSGTGEDWSPEGGTVVGRIVPESEGLALRGRDGKLRPMPELGYEHSFRAGPPSMDRY